MALAAAMPAEAETFAADGATLLSEGDGCDEEVLAADDASKRDDPFEHALTELEVLMMDEGLNMAIDAFTREHCAKFEAGDENKLEYTTLFQDYMALVEAYIEQQLGASVKAFDMGAFCATLQERFKGDESMLDHPALEMLSAYSDFEAFKSLMLATKAGASVEAECGELCVSGDKLGIVGSGLPGEEEGAEEGAGASSEQRPDLDNMLSGVSISASK